MARLRNAYALMALAALAGCGGSSSISNPAKVRFFNVLKSTNANNTNSNTSNVRVLIGGRLLEQGASASFNYGDGLSGYGDAPSGASETITLSPYSSLGTTTASLTSVNLVASRHYTLIALTSGITTSGVVVTDTQQLLLLPDFQTQAANTEYFRVVNASPSVTPVYVRLVNSAGTTVYPTTSTSTVQTVASGASAIYQPLVPGTTSGTANTSDTYTLQMFTDAGGSNLASQTTVSVTLAVGSPKTIVIYDPSSTSTSASDLRVKVVSDTVDGTFATTPASG